MSPEQAVKIDQILIFFGLKSIEFRFILVKNQLKSDLFWLKIDQNSIYFNRLIDQILVKKLIGPRFIF